MVSEQVVGEIVQEIFNLFFVAGEALLLLVVFSPPDSGFALAVVDLP